jgi:hypothetical protein
MLVASSYKKGRLFLIYLCGVKTSSIRKTPGFVASLIVGGLLPEVYYHINAIFNCNIII